MSNDPNHPEYPEYPDALPGGTVRGRGSQLNPANRFETLRLHVLGDSLDEASRESPNGRQAPTEVFSDTTRTILNEVDSPDLPFRWTLNPYRGCEHGCVYCYARPWHEQLGLSCGLDFETKIFAKPEAPKLLRRELLKPRWAGGPVVLSGVTDPYQPIEEKLRITRRCLEVFAEFGHPVSVITKGRLVTRDLDLLGDLAAGGLTQASVSLTTLDNRLASSMEPRASSPGARLKTIEALAKAGVPVRVMTAPIIPGLNDHELPSLLQAAADAGAQSAGFVLLRLAHQLKALFLDWLAREFPDRAGKVESLLRQCRAGELNDPRFATRFKGEGPIAEQIAQSFRVFSRRCGLDKPLPKLNEWDRTKGRGSQGELFS